VGVGERLRERKREKEKKQRKRRSSGRTAGEVARLISQLASVRFSLGTDLTCFSSHVKKAQANLLQRSISRTKIPEKSYNTGS
jgi:hypothetical protein